MTVEIKENTYCVGLWMLVSEADHPKEILEVCEHLGLDPNEMPKTPLEHLCSLYRHGDELWNFDIRQRVILDDKTGADSIDAKKFYRVTFDQQMDEAEAHAHAESFSSARSSIARSTSNLSMRTSASGSPADASRARCPSGCTYQRRR